MPSTYGRIMGDGPMRLRETRPDGNRPCRFNLTASDRAEMHALSSPGTCSYCNVTPAERLASVQLEAMAGQASVSTSLPTVCRGSTRRCRVPPSDADALREAILVWGRFGAAWRLGPRSGAWRARSSRGTWRRLVTFATSCNALRDLVLDLPKSRHEPPSSRPFARGRQLAFEVHPTARSGLRAVDVGTALV